MTLALICSRAAVFVRSCQISASREESVAAAAAVSGAAAKKQFSRVGQQDNKDVLIYTYMGHPPPNLLHHWSRTEQHGVLYPGWSLICTRIDVNTGESLTDIFPTFNSKEWELDT